jgi:yapsin 1
MKLPLLTLLALTTSGLAKNVGSLPGYHNLGFKVTRGSTFQDSSPFNVPKLVKRESPDGTVLTVIDNEYTFYSVQIAMGSEMENVTLLMDTGSSDTWVPGSENLYCSSNAGNSKARIIDDADAYAEIFGSVETIEKRDAWRVVDDADGLSNIQHPNQNDDKAEEVGSATVNNKAAVLSGLISTPTATMDCSEYGTFNHEKSTSFQRNDTDFFILYGDRTYALGFWGYDNVNIGGLQVDDFSFAVANQSNSSMGVVGIGLEGLETTNTGALVSGNAYTYANLPLKLVQDGLINTPAYSLYLNEWDQASGNVLFGGVDHAKYEGNLQIVPIVNTLASAGYSDPIKLTITLSSITLNSSSDSNVITEDETTALLDSGTTLTYLPQAQVSAIASSLGATYSSTYGYYMMSCPSSNSDIELVYSFQGIDITVPISEVVLAADSIGSTCALAIMASDEVILGDSFLRSAYVVYDLKNYEIGLAQANFTDDEDIEVITDRIPSGTRVSDYSSTATGSGNLGATSPANTLTVTTGSVATGTSTGSASGDSADAGVMVSAPSALGIVCLGLGVVSALLLI